MNDSQNIVYGTGDKYYRCDTCSAIHHVHVDVLPLTPACPDMAACGGGEPVTEITESEALGELE